MGLVDYRKDTIGAEESLFFLDTKQTATVTGGAISEGEFHLMFLRAENSSVDTGVETEEIQDVTQKTQPTEVKKYAPTMTLNSYFLKSDPVCIALEKVYRDRAVGSAAHFYMVEVDKWNTNKAYVTDVTVAISNITNEAGDKRKIEATIGYAGDSVLVTQTVSIDEDEGTLSFTE